MPTATPTPTGATADMPPGKTLPPELEKVMSRVSEISSLPEVTARVVQVIEDPRASAHDMHEIVRTDPALAAKILKVVNSSFYGLPSRISSLDRAIVMLGLSAVKNLALAASLSRLFKPQPISDRFCARDLWTHCISVGVCAKLLAKAGAGPVPGQAEECFVAGLMHDLGLLVEQQLFPDKLAIVAAECLRRSQDFCAVERAIVGADHQAFGAVLATKWKFPPGLRYAIAYHHEPNSLRPEFRKLATIVYAADTICSHSQLGFWLTAQTQQVDLETLTAIGLTQERLSEVVAQLPALAQEAEQILAP